MTMDRETIEALRDEPELLAIADALQRAGERLDVPVPVRRRPRPRRVRLAAVAFAVAGVIAVVLASPWSGSSGPSFVEKALAEIGNRPVVHVVVRYSVGERIDLRTGRSMPTHRDLELWYDSARHVFRSVVRLNGRVILRRSGTGDLGTEPFLLTALYRKALKKATLLHKGRKAVLGGHRVVVLQSRQPDGGLSRWYIDTVTYQLVRMQFFKHGRLRAQIDVLRYETVGREQAHLPNPAHLPQPSPGGSQTSDTLSVSGGSALVSPPALAAASRLLGTTALWPGRVVNGHRFASAQLERETVSGHGQKVHGRKAVFDYGLRSQFGDFFLELEVAPTTSALWPAESVSTPAAGYLDLESGDQSTNGQSTRTRWTGVMQKDGLIIRLTSWSRATLLAAARELRPVP